MPKFAIWELRENQQPVKIDGVITANTKELARMKAIIGTKIEYDNVRAYAYKGESKWTTGKK